MRELMLSHSQALYALRLLQRRGRVVETVVGKVALWCRDRESATAFLEEMKREVVRLVEQNRLRYIRPKQLFELIIRDAKAREVFGRVIDVKTSPSAKAYGVLKALLEAMYGKPVAKSVYYTAQPSVNINIDIRDETGEHVPVVLPPHLALALRNADVNEVVLQAIEQLLARYRV
jgi:hypothetical protein